MLNALQLAPHVSFTTPHEAGIVLYLHLTDKKTKIHREYLC